MSNTKRKLQVPPRDKTREKTLLQETKSFLACPLQKWVLGRPAPAPEEGHPNTDPGTNPSAPAAEPYNPLSPRLPHCHFLTCSRSPSGFRFLSPPPEAEDTGKCSLLHSGKAIGGAARPLPPEVINTRKPCYISTQCCCWEL